MSEKVIANALGLRPLEEIREDEIENLPEIIEYDNLPVVPNSVNDENLADIELARSNIKSIVQKGNESLDELLSLAKQSESARAFEVVSTMMNTLLAANKSFVEMSDKKKYAKEDNSTTQQTNVTNNNLILTTADLLKMMKGDKGEK